MPALHGSPLRSRFASIPAALGHWAARTPHAPALTSPGTTQTYAELTAAVRGFAGALRLRGIEAGGRVMLAGDNTLTWVHAYLAVLSIGAIAVPANNRVSPAQFARLAGLLDAYVVLADHEQECLTAACPSWRLLRAADLNAAARDSPATDPGSLVQRGERPAVVSFTSGTTGKPKGAVLTHQGLADAATVFADVIGTGQHASTLVMVPLFHNTGFLDQLGHMLIAGGRTDLLPRFHAREAIAAARERPTTFVTAVPSILRLLMIHDGVDAVFAPATDVLYGGSPMPDAWIRELATRWPHLRLHHGYGLSEFASAVSFLPPELADARGESVGTPAPGVSIRLVGDAGRDVPPGEVGEIWASGPTRMRGYWGLPAVTSAAICDGWLRTGDLARCDGGLLYLCGRTNDVINRGGEKILPKDVETEIAALPGVGQVCVFGAPDPVLQQRVVAVIEPRPGVTFDAGHARATLAGHLPDYAVPEHFFVADNLPRTASGKLDRRLITASHARKRTPHITEDS
jgi:long-chain acyl-CoA synthetase